MRCEECGADVLGEETCLDRFHALLAAEVENDGLRQMHGLTVLTYYLQHPLLTKPWFQISGAETMRRVFAGGEDWSGVLMEMHPLGVGRRRSAARVARIKSVSGAIMPDWVIAYPIQGELTIADIDPTATADQADEILDWARSVAECRYLHR
jgi:hypothetical protein